MQAKLDEQAIRDPLTGLFNRRRVGGEEFCILFERAHIDVVIGRLQEVLTSYSTQKFVLGPDTVCGLTFSAGVALYPHDSTDQQALLERADERLYAAKRAGRARVAAG